MRSQQIVDAIGSSITADLALGDQSRIHFFLDNSDIKGGWEAWLQVEAALAVAKAIQTSTNQRYQIRREVPYAGGSKRCDLQFAPIAGGGGALGGGPIWIEFKTQRIDGYPATLADLTADVTKLATEVGNNGVAVAVAVLLGAPQIGPYLKGSTIPHGTALKAFRYVDGAGSPQTIDPATVLSNKDIVCIVWKNSA